MDIEKHVSQSLLLKYALNSLEQLRAVHILGELRYNTKLDAIVNWTETG
jgi:hypothetical protein